MKLRSYRIDEAAQAVVRAARFRRPQREAFDRIHDLIVRLDDDIPRLTQQRLEEQLRESGLSIPVSPPDLVFELATGVGKTKLMGALSAYFYRASQSRNILILASRTAILEKLERESQQGSTKYLFLDSALIPEPNLCFRSTIESFRPDPTRLNVFILSPQTLSGGERRFSRPTDFGGSLASYLRDANDLVVFTDESHHLPNAGREAGSAWRAAVRDLTPRLHLGLSATPLIEEGSNIVYSYNLAQCLREGLYTKTVRLWVEPKPDNISDDKWDHATLDFGLQRLDRKMLALRALHESHAAFPRIDPVMLVNARDKAHAEEVAEWLRDQRGMDDDEVLVTHSGKAQTEATIRALVNIDAPGNRIKVVVNVFQLTEGWDVTNVYVIVPLRAMATFQNAVQSMGRGLRLPAGRRMEEDEVDSLDVLCFGKETFEDIVRHATDQFGSGPQGSGVISLSRPADDLDPSEPTRPFTVTTKCDVTLAVPSVERMPAEPVLDFRITSPAKDLGSHVVGFDLASLETSDLEDGDGLRRSFDDIIEGAAGHAIAGLSFLSVPMHWQPICEIAAQLLLDLGARRGEVLSVDPLKLGLFVGEEVERRHRQQPVAFRAVSAPVARKITPFDWPLPERLDGPLRRFPLEEW